MLAWKDADRGEASDDCDCDDADEYRGEVGEIFVPIPPPPPPPPPPENEATLLPEAKAKLPLPPPPPLFRRAERKLSGSTGTSSWPR